MRLIEVKNFNLISIRKVSFSQKVQLISRCLGLRDPAIVQGMYIFKNPGIGKNHFIRIHDLVMIFSKNIFGLSCKIFYEKSISH